MTQLVIHLELALLTYELLLLSLAPRFPPEVREGGTSLQSFSTLAINLVQLELRVLEGKAPLSAQLVLGHQEPVEAPSLSGLEHEDVHLVPRVL